MIFQHHLKQRCFGKNQSVHQLLPIHSLIDLLGIFPHLWINKQRTRPTRMVCLITKIGILTRTAAAVSCLLLLPSLASGSANGGEQGTSTSTTTTTICSPPSKTFTVKLNFGEGELGYYEFDECEGHSPTIGLVVGETYTFVQGDVSNWYHPLGFAYGPDGAHDDQDEFEKGISRTSNSSCITDMKCPAPQYKRNGEFLANASVPEDFGLDAYEPLFFYPLLDWMDMGTFSIDVTFDDATIRQDAFYFCHVRTVMLSYRRRPYYDYNCYDVEKA
jgi:hypothetical protein